MILPLAVSAQHTRSALTQPDYDDYNLRGWPCKIKVMQTYADGNDINFEETYIFDSVGRVTEYVKRGYGGERVVRYPLTVEQLSQNRRYSFDFDGDLLELRRYNDRGILYSSEHYIYGEGGNLIQKVEYAYSSDSGVVTKRTVSAYDKHERLKTVEQYSADELLLWREKRRYDRRGNLVVRRQTFYHEDETDTSMERRKYSYDRRGNWVRCDYSLNGRPVYSILRAIDYYGD